MNHSKAQQIGNIGERWVYDQLVKRGYDITMIPDYLAHCVDLKIGTLPIEVKYARIGYRRKINRNTGERKRYQRWQWNVSQLDNNNRVLFLIAEDENGIKHPFIMPGSVMDTRVNFQIQRHPTEYMGFISGYLNAWETIDFLLEKQYHNDKQLTIYHYLTGETTA